MCNKKRAYEAAKLEGIEEERRRVELIASQREKQIIHNKKSLKNYENIEIEIDDFTY